MPSPNEISVAQLSRRVGMPDQPAIVDVCIDDDFNIDPTLIPASFRHPFKKIADLAPALQGRKTVIVCHRGLKLSQGAAARLRAEGISAEFLQGGIVAWRQAELPCISAAAIPNKLSDGSTLWVTRQRPKIDRIACPWLIRRFVDPKAKFLFVAPSEILAIADRFQATAFDCEGAEFSHTGSSCSFDQMLNHFQLSFPALQRVADIVRAADLGQLSSSPEAPGLLAISLGLSRMYRDDIDQLNNGMMIYDALYRWARDAKSETHTAAGH